jgi:hypothetical protein
LITVAKSLGIDIVAEGGYLFSHAVDPEAAWDFLAHHSESESRRAQALIQRAVALSTQTTLPKLGICSTSAGTVRLNSHSTVPRDDSRVCFPGPIPAR